MRKITVIIILGLLILGAVFMATNKWPSRLRVINKSEDGVVLNLGIPYQWLYVPAGEEITFTLPKDEYSGSIWWCGETTSQTMDLTHNLKLNFPSCYGAPSRIGERSQEKVDIVGGPKRDFMFQY